MGYDINQVLKPQMKSKKKKFILEIMDGSGCKFIIFKLNIDSEFILLHLSI